jgi:hypothetical protein
VVPVVMTRKKLKMFVDNFDILFPEPDPNARIEDIIGRFKGIVPKDKSSVRIIREERNRMFGVDEPIEDD